MCLGGGVLKGENQIPWNGNIPYDYMLWIDSDISWEYKDFENLYSMNVDIASGLYLMDSGNRNPQEYAAVENWDENYFQQHGRFEFLTKESIKNKKDPFVVNYTGFGFILIKRGVMESVDQLAPYGSRVPEKVLKPAQLEKKRYSAVEKKTKEKR